VLCCPAARGLMNAFGGGKKGKGVRTPQAVEQTLMQFRPLLAEVIEQLHRRQLSQDEYPDAKPARSYGSYGTGAGAGAAGGAGVQHGGALLTWLCLCVPGCAAGGSALPCGKQSCVLYHKVGPPAARAGPANSSPGDTCMPCGLLLLTQRHDPAAVQA
jgi:hypothetical protein